MDADEFIRRFLMHVLPKGFRHFGFLADACRVEELARIRAALAFPKPERPAEPQDYREHCVQLTGKRIDVCPFCGGSRYRLVAASLSAAANSPLRLLMTSNPRTTLLPLTNITVRAVQGRMPANLRLVAHRQECRPTIPNKTVAESPSLATATCQTSPWRQIEARPAVLKSAFITPRLRRTPIDGG